MSATQLQDADSGWDVRSVSTTETASWPLPAVLNGQSVYFGDRLIGQFPPQACLTTRNGFAQASPAIVWSKHLDAAYSTSWHDRSVAAVAGHPAVASGCSRLDGTVVSLASDFASMNYGHFLLDSLSRLAILHRANISIDAFDHVYLPGSGATWQQKLVERFGIPISKCIWGVQSPVITASSITATTFPGYRRNYLPWICDWVRQRNSATGSPGANRRLFVMREGPARSILNFQDLIPVIDKFKLEIYYPTRETDCWKDFSEAELVVGVHGAGLADIVFCRRETSVVEIMPHDHAYPYYYSLAHACRLKHFLYIAEAPGSDEISYGPTNSSIYVDPQDFGAALKSVSESI